MTVAKSLFLRVSRRIRRHFGLSVAQGNQVFNTLLFIALLILGIVCWKNFSPAISLKTDFEKHTNDILTSYKLKKEEEAALYNKKDIHIEPNIFNPNSASQEDLEKLGLPKHIAENIIRYRKAGGTFRTKADFKKIYGLKPEWYKALLPFISLPDTLPRFEYANSNNLANKYIPKSKRLHHVFDINEADTSVWEDFPGIGEGMSHRIIEYRTRLGGFVSVDQVKEVYGMDSSILCELKPYMRVSPNNLACININKVGVDDLAKHPYIKYKEAKAIVQYRIQHGDYDQVSSLRFVKSLPWEWIERVSPYLCTK